MEGVPLHKGAVCASGGADVTSCSEESPGPLCFPALYLSNTNQE